MKLLRPQDISRPKRELEAAALFLGAVSGGRLDTPSARRQCGLAGIPGFRGPVCLPPGGCLENNAEKESRLCHASVSALGLVGNIPRGERSGGRQSSALSV